MFLFGRMGNKILFSFVLFAGFFLINTHYVFADQQAVEKRVALTFDDGPYGTSTTEILDILKKDTVPATFFVMGENAQKYPDLIKDIIKDGNVIGNHTYNHPKDLIKETEKEFDAEIDITNQLVFSLTGLHTALFRAPYGLISTSTKTELQKKDYTLVGWDVDSVDWDYTKSTPGVILATVLKEIKPNSIIIFHDGRDTHIDYPRDNIVKALPEVIGTLKKQGYEFVTVDKILKVKPYKNLL